MAKESGLGATVSVDDSGGTPRDISNDITTVSISTPRGIQEVTGINVSGMERILLLADVETELNGVFNDAANMSHVVFKTVTSTSVARTTSFAVSGQTLSCEEVYDNYELSRSDSGELTWSTTGRLSDGTPPTWS